MFEHNPLNPITQYIVKNCPFDKDAQLIKQGCCIQLLKTSGLGLAEKRYIVFFPRILKSLRSLEKYLSSLPLGAQYFVAAQK